MAAWADAYSWRDMFYEIRGKVDAEKTRHGQEGTECYGDDITNCPAKIACINGYCMQACDPAKGLDCGDSKCAAFAATEFCL